MPSSKVTPNTNCIRYMFRLLTCPVTNTDYVLAGQEISWCSVPAAFTVAPSDISMCVLFILRVFIPNASYTYDKLIT